MTWITVKEAAELLCVTERAVRSAALRNQYIVTYTDGVGGNHGKNLLISLESLPEEAQDKYNKKVITEKTGTYKASQKKCEDAEFKTKVVRELMKCRLSCAKFVEKFNAENGTNITQKQVYDWKKKYRNGGVSELIDNRGGHNRGCSSIPNEVWEFFLSLYLTEDRRTLKWCYRETKKHFGSIPTEQAFARKASTIPEQTKILYREGKEAFKLFTQFYERDPALLKSNDIWFSDHTTLDILVNVNGKPKRPFLTAWMDAHSRKIVSWVLRDKSPNTDIVKATLGEGIKEFGVPEEVYVDNGKDYRAKDGLSKAYSHSMASILGINTIYATPYHGQAKTIERFFGTLEDQFSKQFKTYIGSNAKNRPERTKRKSDEQLLKAAPTLEEVIEKLDNYIKLYNETQHGGKGMDNLSPNEVYFRDLEEKREIEDYIAFRTLCGRVKEYTVQRNGLRINEATFYDMELVIKYFHKKVRVYYDPNNIDEISVFTLKDEFICNIRAKEMSVFRNRTSEDYREAKREQKRFREAIAAYGPNTNIDVNQIIAQNQAKELANLPERKLGEHTKVVKYEVPLFKEFAEKSTAINSQRADEEDESMEITKTMLKSMRNSVKEDENDKTGTD